MTLRFASMADLEASRSQGKRALAPAGTKARPRPQHKPGQMNKTEARYCDEQLELFLRMGLIREYQFERMKFRLADKTFYTPDFFVLRSDTIEFHEIKGGGPIEDDAMVKFKVTAAQNSWARWLMIRYNAKDKSWTTLLDL